MTILEDKAVLPDSDYPDAQNAKSDIWTAA